MYLTKAYLELAFGATNVATLCESDDEIDTTIELAEAEVEGALAMGGYTTAYPSSVYTAIEDVPKIVKLAAYGAWLELAHLRNRKELPATASIYTKKIAVLASGDLEIPGLPQNTRRAPGGVDFTQADPDVERGDGNNPRVFGTGSLSGM